MTIMKRQFLPLALAAICCAHTVAAEPAKPNIVLIVADDLGCGDLSCYGATKIKTPNIDRLAAEGLRLTDAHAPAAVCNPSRYALLSGTYMLRAKPHGDYQLWFHEGQDTLPSVLKSAGYRTACIGKWHNGFGRGAEPDYNAELKPGPLEIGFDYFFGLPRSHNEPPFVFVENHRVYKWDAADPIRIIPHSEVVQRGLKDPAVAEHLKNFKVSEAELVKKGLKDWGWGISEGGKAAHDARPNEHIDDILATKAVDFIGTNKSQPFFVYLPFQAPHVPITPSREFQGTSQAGDYGDYIQQLDDCVGKVLDHLQTQGLSDNTLVFLSSDNGGLYLGEPLKAGHHCNASLLGQKTDAWEGGHRVPFIARWPGRIPTSTVGSQLFDLTDVMATLAAAAKIRLPEGAAPDSLDQLQVLLHPTVTPAVRTELLSQGTGGYVLRQSDWVYIPKQGSSGMTVQMPPGQPWGQPYANMGVTNSDITAQGKVKPDAPADQLYNLRDDPSEKTNVTLQHPERAKAMRARLDEILGKSASTPAKPRAAKPMLFANYYTWYSTGTGPNQTWTHWIRHPVAEEMAKEAKRTGKVVEKLGPDDIASVFWPLAGLYNSDDKEIVRWHIRLAKAAGIDAFLVDWWGPQNWGNVPGLTYQTFADVVLPIAAEEGFKVCMFDEPVNFRPLDQSKEWAATYLKQFKDNPAYLKIDGKPVYCIYQVPFNPGLTPEKFTELRAYVEERVGPVYWIVDAINNENDNFRIPEAWRPVAGISSFSFYGTFSIFEAHTYGQLAERYARVVQQAHEAGKKMLVPVHPGHDNMKSITPGDPRYEMPRRDGQTFRDFLRAATDAGADYVMVTSFNEWPESTCIEPSSSWNDPYQYLKILAEWKGVKFVKPEEPKRIQGTAK